MGFELTTLVVIDTDFGTIALRITDKYTDLTFHVTACFIGM
jgi:hypothetical protein